MLMRAETNNQSAGDDAIILKAGNIEIRLAATDEELKAAQMLRYQVFYQEMNAKASDEMKSLGRDYDDFDDICDHLLAFDTNKSGPESVIATYRLLREEKINSIDDFYSSQEFDLSNFNSAAFKKLKGNGQLLELGRSCVREDYRSNNIIQLMWRAIVRYLGMHNVTFLFGCASLAGTDQKALELPLSYLYEAHKTPDDINIPAVKSRYQKMNYLSGDALDVKKAKRLLAPLVRGYVRLGCYIGDGAVIDEEFGTTDVFILLSIDTLRQKSPSLFES